MVSDTTLYRRHFNLYFVTKKKPNLSTITSLNLSSSQSSPEVNQTSNLSSGRSQSTVQLYSTLTDNTLSMVTTPWSTESWSSQDFFIPLEKNTSTPIPSTTTMPGPSSSSGGCTPDLDGSHDTFTILKPEDSFSCKSFTILPLTVISSDDSLETLNSWTVESFTSPVEYSDSNIIKVSYPWSPCTFLSGTDLYPSTTDTFNSNVASLVTTSLNSGRDTKFSLTNETLRTGKNFYTSIEYECLV